MHHSFTQLPKSEAEILVTIPFGEFEPHVKRAAVVISEETDMEGFRRGKAPYDVVKTKIGESRIYERAADIAIRKTYPDILRKLLAEQPLLAGNPPIGTPEITVTKLAPGNELQYKAKIAFLPLVELPDYRTITPRIAKEKKEVAVTEDEVDKSIAWIRESRMTRTPVERPAAHGDAVEIDFDIRHGGVKIEGGESKNHPLVIGKGRFLPGVEEQLIGMHIGEEREFSVTMPEEWHQKNFASKALDIKAVMRRIEEAILPELTESFIKTLGTFESVEALKQSIRDGILQEKKEKEKQRVRILIIEAIAKESKAEVPVVLITAEIEKMFNELKSGVQEMGMQWEDYLVHVKKNMEDLRKEWQEEAEKRVLIALILREIAKREKIEPEKEKIEERANQYLMQYGSTDEAHKAIDPKDLYDYMKGIMRNEQVFEFLEKMG
ncbi:MAG: trigger factor [bacterium]|nr:trigger factor [bacterium]